jgi:hypothetical protein
MGAPAAIAGAGMGASLLGSLFGASGAERTGAAQSQMYNYQAGVAQLNSKIALQNADYARQIGEQQAAQTGEAEAQRIGQIKAAQGSSGLDVGGGSAAAVRAGQHRIAEIDMTTLREGAAKTAYSYDVQSKQYDQQAQLYKMAGADAMQAGRIKAATSILGGVTAVSSEWLQGQKFGLFS